MSVCVRIAGAPDYKIESALVVFKNKNRSYPICGLPDSLAKSFCFYIRASRGSYSAGIARVRSVLECYCRSNRSSPL